MVKYPELDEYVQKARVAGMTDASIRQKLLESKWNVDCIEEAFLSTQAESQHLSSNFSRHWLLLALLLFVIVGLSGIVIVLWNERIDLADKNNIAVRQFFVRLAEGKVGFTDAGDLVFPDDKKFFDTKQDFMQQRKNFVEADLTEMRLRLYESGSFVKEFPILAKGKEGSWWETPTGSYTALKKEQNHYSSIGNVWMPWSVQFYGNFFIHGWPYNDAGELVPQGYSGGCIRLSTENAKELYHFLSEGTSILVRESSEEQRKFGAVFMKESAPPSVSAHSFLVANLITGEHLLKKIDEKIMPIASLTKLMTAIVASELVYLERSILVRNDLLAATIARFDPKVGDRYIAFDLLYPLLMQSSNQAANILSGFLGQKKFVEAMNEKSISLDMNDTHFEDVSGIGNKNISSAGDLFKLLQYIYFKRHFIFDIGKGETYRTYSGIHKTDLANFNEFVDDGRLVGMKNGETSDAKQTSASVFEFASPSGPVPVAIVVLGSNNRKLDTEALLNWIENSIEFK